MRKGESERELERERGRERERESIKNIRSSENRHKSKLNANRDFKVILYLTKNSMTKGLRDFIFF